MIPHPDLRLEENERWKHVDALVRTIEYSGEKELAGQTKARFTKINDYISSYEDEDMVIRIVKKDFLEKELSEKCEKAKWGKYLRAPDVYFELIEEGRKKKTMVPLKEIADIRRGYTTGINDFFYLERDGENYKNAAGWSGKIEAEYLKPVIKSPKESNTIEIDPVKLKFRLFICNKSKDELKSANHYGALNYIEWGEMKEPARERNTRKYPV